MKLIYLYLSILVHWRQFLIYLSRMILACDCFKHLDIRCILFETCTICDWLVIDFVHVRYICAIGAWSLWRRTNRSEFLLRFQQQSFPVLKSAFQNLEIHIFLISDLPTKTLTETGDIAFCSISLRDWQIRFRALFASCACIFASLSSFFMSPKKMSSFTDSNFFSISSLEICASESANFCCNCRTLLLAFARFFSNSAHFCTFVV